MFEAFQGTVIENPIREYTIHHSLNGHFSIRKDKWKLTPHLGSGGFSVPTDEDPFNEGMEGTLYDLIKDPMETTNLYNQYPTIVNDLSAILEQSKNGQ